MPWSPRFAGFSAIAGALLGIVLTPPMASVWAYDPPFTNWAGLSWVARTFGPTLESAGALSFGRADLGPYEVYGKGFFLVYLLMVPAVRLVHEMNASSARAGRLELWSWRVMYWALLVAALGDFASYWGVSLPGVFGEVLWSGGFGVEILAFFVLISATTVFGIASLRLRVLPLWAASLLTAAIPIAFTGFFATLYVPNAVAVPVSLVWAAIGVWLMTQPQEALATA